MPQVIDIQVLAITQGFAPALRLYAPSEVLIQSATNSAMATAAHLTGLELASGIYRVEVASANGMPGQFVIGVQAGSPQKRVGYTSLVSATLPSTVYRILRPLFPMI